MKTIVQQSQSRLGILFVLGLISCAMLACDSSHAQGQEFRIESQVYSGDEKLPVSQNVTLFSERIVYDFQLSNDAQPKPMEVVIFDARSRMMVLLDPTREVRLELPELRLIKILDGVRRETMQESRTSFLVNDEFKVDNGDWGTDWVTLESPQITYRYKGSRPADATVLPIYYDFLDNFTRLIATDPTKIPPFARIELNKSIRTLGHMPLEVQISAKKNGLFRMAFSAKSTHVLVNQLSDTDKQRIAKAKSQWLNFRSVGLAEYRGLPEQPKLGTFPLKGSSQSGLEKVVTASHTTPAGKSRVPEKSTEPGK